MDIKIDKHRFILEEHITGDTMHVITDEDTANTEEVLRQNAIERNATSLTDIRKRANRDDSAAPARVGRVPFDVLQKMKIEGLCDWTKFHLEDERMKLLNTVLRNPDYAYLRTFHGGKI